MKIATNTVTFDGELSGERIDMKIDPTAFAHVMQALANLYTNNEMAVLREISTNARDAHIEAGMGHLPIEVTLPSDLDPYLRIKDYGPGLDRDDIESVFSQYGASTKRDTNDQVGSLGFGCKSPLAYTDQFCVISIKNGVKLNVLVSKDEDGGNMKIVTREKTTEHSGVTVEIPAARWNNFDREARKLFRFWEPGTVLVNGVEPDRIQGRAISDDMMIVSGNTNYVVMGNVPYPIDRDRFKTDLNDGHALVVRVPIGAVEFAPSREGLRYTKITRTLLEKVSEDFTIAIQTAVQDAVNKCKTRPEVIDTIIEWRKTLPESRVKGNYIYKGKVVPHIYEVPGAAKDNRKRAITTSRTSNKLSAKEYRERLDISWWANSLVVTEYDRENFSPTTKKKLKKYADDNGLTVENFILLREKPSRTFTQWLDKTRLVNFETIAAIQLPRSYNGGRRQVGRIPGSYDMWVAGTYSDGLPADDIDQDEPIFYLNGKYGCASGYVDIVTGAHPNCTIVIMPPNRIAKFERCFPQAQPLRPELPRIFKEWASKLTINQKAWLNIHCLNSSLQRELASIDPTKVEDRMLKRGARLAKKSMPVLEKQWQNFYYSPLSWDATHDEKLFKFDNPLQKYPLFDQRVLRNNPDHAYLYINAVHAYLQNDSK